MQHLSFFHLAWTLCPQCLAGKMLTTAQRMLSIFTTPWHPTMQPSALLCAMTSPHRAGVPAVPLFSTSLVCQPFAFAVPVCRQALTPAILHSGLPVTSTTPLLENLSSPRPPAGLSVILCATGSSWVHLTPADCGHHVSRIWVQKWFLENDG